MNCCSCINNRNFQPGGQKNEGQLFPSDSVSAVALVWDEKPISMARASLWRLWNGELWFFNLNFLIWILNFCIFLIWHLFQAFLNPWRWVLVGFTIPSSVLSLSLQWLVQLCISSGVFQISHYLCRCRILLGVYGYSASTIKAFLSCRLRRKLPSKIDLNGVLKSIFF